MESSSREWLLYIACTHGFSVHPLASRRHADSLRWEVSLAKTNKHSYSKLKIRSLKGESVGTVLGS